MKKKESDLNKKKSKVFLSQNSKFIQIFKGQEQERLRKELEAKLAEEERIRLKEEEVIFLHHFL